MFDRVRAKSPNPPTPEVEEKSFCSDEFISDFAVYLPDNDSSGASQNQEAPIPNHYW